MLTPEYIDFNRVKCQIKIFRGENPEKKIRQKKNLRVQRVADAGFPSCFKVFFILNLMGLSTFFMFIDDYLANVVLM